MRIMRFAQSDQAMDGEEEAPGPTFCDSGPREGRGGIKRLRHEQVCFPKKILFGQLPPILRVLVHANSSQNLCVRKPLGTCLPSVYWNPLQGWCGLWRVIRPCCSQPCALLSFDSFSGLSCKLAAVSHLCFMRSFVGDTSPLGILSVLLVLFLCLTMAR